MKRIFLFVMVYDTETGVVRDTVECSSLHEALTMLMNAENTFYAEPDIKCHVEEHVIEYPN